VPIKMPTPFAFGAFVGFAGTCFKRGLQVLPWYRKPWEHAAAAVATGYAFTWIVEKEAQMVQEIEQRYKKMGMAVQKSTSS
jgi:hypothetical protein